MRDEARLPEQARPVVRGRHLPARRIGRWGRPGVGAACAVREMPVTENQPELEIGFVCDPDMPELDKFHVHVPCFAAREFERDKATR